MIHFHPKTRAGRRPYSSNSANAANSADSADSHCPLIPDP